jgi:hypothetical protein
VLHRADVRIAFLGTSILAVLFMIYTSDISLSIHNRSALACVCAPTSLEEDFEFTDAVFSGRVHDIDRQESRIFTDIEIYRVWKGDPDPIVTMQGDPGECPFYLQEGEEYLVFAYKVTPSIERMELYSTNLCLPSSHLQGAGDTILALDAILNRELDSLILSTDFQNQTYTIYGNATEGIKVKGLTFYQDYGVSLNLEPAEKEEWIELLLPKDVVSNITHLEVTRSDYTVVRTIDRMTSNETHTVVGFAVPEEAYMIEVRATHVAPEFAILAPIMAAVSIAGLIVWARSTERMKI